MRRSAVGSGHGAGRRHHQHPLGLSLLMFVCWIDCIHRGECKQGAKVIGVATDLASNSSEVHQSMMVMVMMGITVDDHWMLYMTGYRAKSTSTGSSVKKGARIEFSKNS